MRILLATEEITARPAEGLLVFVMHLARYLHRLSDLTILYAGGEPEEGHRALELLSSKCVVTLDLVRFLRTESFDIVIYVPSSSFTAYGLLRAAVLRSLAKAPTIVIAMQHRKIGKLHTLFSRLTTPELVLTPVGELGLGVERLGLRTGFIIPGFDEAVFTPVSHETKAALRRKYGLPQDQYIVLHVGHIKENRNMQVLLKHRDWGRDIVPVVKGGEVEHSWLHRLQMAGVIVFDEYLDRMHELYQASDCYLFPVSSPTGALEFPLSVVEAAACNLPVITTPFGALPEIIREGDGFHYIRSFAEIPDRIASIRSSPIHTSDKVIGLSWNSVFAKYLEPHIRRLGRRAERNDRE
jgi:glycosyltransferase involved in cell wall biosynthesis